MVVMSRILFIIQQNSMNLTSSLVSIWLFLVSDRLTANPQFGTFIPISLPL